MFWTVITVVIVFFVVVYVTFSTLIDRKGQFPAFGNSTSEDQRLEALDYLDRHLRCGSNLSALQGGVSRGHRIRSFPSKKVTDNTIILVKSLDEGYSEFRMESRIDGQTVNFWTRTGSEGLPTPQGSVPFILYLSRFSKDKIPVEETSLLSRPEFNIVAPYIYSDLDWISTTSSNYTFGDISFEAYVLAKVQGVLDYITVAYDNPPIIAYGEEWGSVIARELALVDDRVDLVISTRFPGDPGLLLGEEVFSKELDTEWLLKGVYGGSEVRCFPNSLGSFVGLIPRPHIYVGSSTPDAFYSMGQEDLSSFLKTRYSEVGFPENFRYIESPSLEVTNFEELVLTVYEFIWNVRVKETGLSGTSGQFNGFRFN